MPNAQPVPHSTLRLSEGTFCAEAVTTGIAPAPVVHAAEATAPSLLAEAELVLLVRDGILGDALENARVVESGNVLDLCALDRALGAQTVADVAALQHVRRENARALCRRLAEMVVVLVRRWVRQRFASPLSSRTSGSGSGGGVGVLPFVLPLCTVAHCFRPRRLWWRVQLECGAEDGSRHVTGEDGFWANSYRRMSSGNSE